MRTIQGPDRFLLRALIRSAAEPIWRDRAPAKTVASHRPSDSQLGPQPGPFSAGQLNESGPQINSN